MNTQLEFIDGKGVYTKQAYWRTQRIFRKWRHEGHHRGHHDRTPAQQWKKLTTFWYPFKREDWGWQNAKWVAPWENPRPLLNTLLEVEAARERQSPTSDLDD